MKRLTAAAVVFVATVAIAGCSNSAGNASDVGPTDPTAGNGNPSGAAAPPAPAATAALFQPAQGVFPWPNDLYFSGTTDGTLNIQPANGLIPNQVGINALDGWSTTAPIRVRFGGALDPTSFSAATVRMYQVTTSPTNKSVAGFTRPLTFGTDFSVNVATDTGVGNTILEIKPLVPLVPSSGASPTSPGVGYLVLLTNGIRMANGAAATADRDYATIKTTLLTAAAPTDSVKCATLPNAAMQGACGFTLSHLLTNDALGPLKIDRANIILSFHFSTQSTQDTLKALGATIAASPAGAIAVNAAPGTPLNLINAALPPIANARFGTVTVPYYSYIPMPLSAGGMSTDSAVLRTAWKAAVTVGGEQNLTRFNPLPQKMADKPIPLLVTVPNANAGPAGVKPANGWPVVIFQHGITRDRSDALALAGAMAQAGWVVAAVDLPLHGVTSTASPLYQAANEQTFNLDLIVNASGATGPDSVIDPTGTHFINLTYPLASRDNLRQGVVNQLALLRALPTLDLDGDPNTPDIDGTRVAFVGQSLGSITGITFGAVIANPALVPRMTFSVPGGGVAELLQTSPTFGPRINAGLQTQGLLPGTSLYAQYFRDTQQIVDAGDPLNYVGTTASLRTIYFQQVVGATTPPPLPDQVIPNSATQRLIAAAQRAVGAANFPRVVPGTPRAGSGYVNFIAGDHGSLLSPTASLPATQEMQTETVIFTAGLSAAAPGGPIPAGTIVAGAATPAPVQP